MRFQIYGVMVKRKLQTQLLQYLDFFPAVGLIGPRQVGKTTLSQYIASVLPRPVQYFDLERAEDYERLRQDAGFFLEQYADQMVIIDEVQRLPQLFAELRGLIDRNRIPGRFLLLGSASPLLLRATSDSLAGRIAYLTLLPLDLQEIENAKTQVPQHWLRGGFPDSFLVPSESFSKGFYNVVATLQTKQNFIITFNSDSYKLKDNVWVMPLNSFTHQISTLV